MARLPRRTGPHPGRGGGGQPRLRSVRAGRPAPVAPASPAAPGPPGHRCPGGPGRRSGRSPRRRPPSAVGRSEPAAHGLRADPSGQPEPAGGRPGRPRTRRALPAATPDDWRGQPDGRRRSGEIGDRRSTRSSLALVGSTSSRFASRPASRPTPTAVAMASASRPAGSSGRANVGGLPAPRPARQHPKLTRAPTATVREPSAIWVQWNGNRASPPPRGPASISPSPTPSSKATTVPARPRRPAHGTILAIGNSMMSVAPWSLSAGIRVLMVCFGHHRLHREGVLAEELGHRRRLHGRQQRDDRHRRSGSATLSFTSTRSRAISVPLRRVSNCSMA